jgi:spore germination protein KB
MLEGGKISGRQAVYLLVVTMLPVSFLFLPHLMYAEARRDAWLSVILVTAFGLVAGEIIGRLAERFPNQTVIGYSRILLGKYLGWAIGLVFAVFYLYVGATALRGFSESVVINFLPWTPVAVFMVATVVVVVYMIRHGLEVLSRVNDLVLPLVLALVIVLLVLTVGVGAVKVENLTPILAEGTFPVVRGAVPAAAFSAMTFVMLMLAPFLVQPEETRAVITRAVLVVGFFQLLLVSASVAVLGGLLEHTVFPVLQLARLVVIGVIENIDLIILFLWILGGVLKVAVLHYCSTLATAQLLGLKNYGPVAVVNGLILAVLATWFWENVLDLGWEDFIELLHLTAVQGPPFFLLIQVGLPLLLLAVAIVTGKRVKKHGQ